MYARQAIQTRYCGPTNTKPGRIKVWCDAKTRFIEWDHGANPCENHHRAALMLAKELGWASSGWGFGTLPNNNGCVLTFPTSP